MGSSMAESGWEAGPDKISPKQLPALSMLLLLAPPKPLATIKGLLRTFLWQGGKNGGGKKIALISWKKIKLPRMEGGL